MKKEKVPPRLPGASRKLEKNVASLSDEDYADLRGEYSVIKNDRLTQMLVDVAPPRNTAGNQSEGFNALLKRLYAIEERWKGPMPHETRVAFAEARAICERFLPPPFVSIMRKRYGLEG